MIRSVAIALALLWTAPVIPEKVELSDRGIVDLAPFACTDTPRSSVVRRVCYDEARRYLLINVRGAYRDYCELPAATFNAFIAAPSMGHFYAQNIAASDRDGPFHCRTQRPQTDQKSRTGVRGF